MDFRTYTVSEYLDLRNKNKAKALLFFSSLTNFEAIAFNDCWVRTTDYFLGDNNDDGNDGAGYYMLLDVKWLLPWTLVCSFIVSMLILSQKQNRSSYPRKFLGLICLCQAGSFWTEFYYPTNFCDNWQN